MKKSDLENGMVIEWDFGERGIIINDSIRYETGFDRLSILSEDLNYKGDKINKIFIVKEECCGLSSIFIDDNLELIWKRKDEIDWTKVPKGIKVIVSDKEEEIYHPNKLDCVFIGYEPMLEERPFIVKGLLGATSYKYCEIHPDTEIKKEWYK